LLKNKKQLFTADKLNNMKITSRIYVSILATIVGILFSCNKEKVVPEVITAEVKEVTDLTALCGSTLTSDGGSKIITCGACWSTDTSNLNISNAKYSIDSLKDGYITSTITNLTLGTKYYVKAYASNKIGTGYGHILSFITKTYNSNIVFNPAVNYGNIIDQDGNTYKTVSIGSQVWMAENLKAITYNNGTSLSLESGTRAPDYYWYDSNPNLNKSIYGALYPDWVVNSGKLCPVGWHIPSDEEWLALVNFIGGEWGTGGKLRESGIVHWQLSNEGATNETGFTALPGGMVSIPDKKSINMGTWGYYWSSFQKKDKWTGVDVIVHGVLPLRVENNDAYFSYVYFNGYYSVRCLED
jgi:uncharacterized protein (TIGR02145 family)